MKLDRQQVPFVQIANEVLYRTDISFKAKGLFAYLFSKPEGWEFAGDRIVRETKDGRKIVFAALKELEEAGLLKRTRQPDGKMQYRLEYAESQMPETVNSLFEPLAPFGKVPKRSMTETGSISNKDVLSNKDKPTAASAVEPFSLEKEILKLEDSPRRDLNIIAFYLRKRRPFFQNKDQFNVAIRRHLRAAKELTPFDDTQLAKGAAQAKEKYPEWTLETVTKILTK